LVQHARKPGGRGPGGWWIFIEIHVAYPRGEVYATISPGGGDHRPARVIGLAARHEAQPVVERQAVALWRR
jgi:hypothetical protein